MARNVRERVRDDREFDTTSLRASFHGKNLSRDYTAHFFRWNFVRNFVRPTSNILEIGCGPDKPLVGLLFRDGPTAKANSYLGVDLNPLDPKRGGAGQRTTFIGEFNFVKDWKKLKPQAPAGGFDVVVHLEVIEHMKVEHGRSMLKGCFELLAPGGVMLMSTPCYDGHRHAANHIHEFTVPELEGYVRKAGFTVERRWGTFMDIRLLKSLPSLEPGLRDAVRKVHAELNQYYDSNAISCFFAPLFPDHARNNLWVCRKPH